MWESRSDLYCSTLVLFYCFSWFLCSSHDWWMLSGTIRPPRWRAAFRFLVSAIVFALKICKWFLLGIYFKKNFSTNMNQEKSVHFLLPVPLQLQEQRQLKAMLGYKEPPSLGWQKLRSSRFTWEILKHLALHLGFLGHLPLSPNLTWKSSTGANFNFVFASCSEVNVNVMNVCCISVKAWQPWWEDAASHLGPKPTRQRVLLQVPREHLHYETWTKHTWIRKVFETETTSLTCLHVFVWKPSFLLLSLLSSLVIIIIIDIIYNCFHY